jgi:hypothetical protein
MVWILVVLGHAIYYKKIIAPLVSLFVFFLIRHGWLSLQLQVQGALAPGGPTLTSILLSTDLLGSLLVNYSNLFLYLWNNLIIPFGYLWLIVASTLIMLVRNIRAKHIHHELLILASLIILCSGIAVGGIIVFSTFFDTWADIGDSARRMMMFITPLGIVLLALIKQGKNK